MSENLYKTDTNAVLRFFEQPEKNNFASEQAGKPIFDTVLKAEVITPGQSASTLEVEIERVFSKFAGSKTPPRRSRYYDKYKAQVEAYRSDSGEYVDSGTPVRSWAQIDRGTAETLAAQGIYTVEALAGISDTALGNLGTGARTLREQAKSFLLSREFGVPSAQTSAENVALKEENTRLAEENATLKAQISALQAAAEATPKVQTKKTPAQNTI